MTLTFRQGQGLSFHELMRLAAVKAGTYNFPDSAGGVVSVNAGLTVNITSITATAVTINAAVAATNYVGSTLTAAASSSTLDRIDTIYYDGTATLAIAQGSPVLTTATLFPTPPTLSAGQIAVANLFVGKGYTSFAASDIDDRRDSYVTAAITLAGSSSAVTSTVSTSAVDLVTISGLGILVSQGFTVSHNFRKTATAAQDVFFGLKENSTVIAEAATATYTAHCSTNNRAEDGICMIFVTPRSTANYLQGLISMYATRVSSSGATSGTPGINNLATSAASVNATVTSIAIRAVNDTSNNNAEVASVRVFAGIP